MAATPPFLRHLNLTAPADERAVRRAYAQLLKQIDQETDPQAFQTLREAYESALSWVRYQARQVQEATDECESPAPAEPAVTPEAPRAAAPAMPEEPDEFDELDESDETVPAQPAPQVVANDVFDGFVATFPSGLHDQADAAQRLDRWLSDDRLINLDVRDFFEWRVAEWLAQGWRPGNEFLFVVACERFKWLEDRRRLVRFGQVGQVLDAAISERQVFDRQAAAERHALIEAIRRLREGVHPGARFLLKNTPALERAARQLPNWMRLITRVDDIQTWRDWERAVPNWLRLLALHAIKRSPPQPDQPPKKKWRWQWAVFVMGVVYQILKGWDDPSWVTPPSIYQDDPSWSQPVQLPAPIKAASAVLPEKNPAALVAGSIPRSTHHDGPPAAHTGVPASRYRVPRHESGHKSQHEQPQEMQHEQPPEPPHQPQATDGPPVKD